VIALRTLLICAILAGMALAFVPSAAATPPCDPEQPCDPQPIDPIDPDCTKVPERAPLLVVTPDCKVIVSVDAINCPFGEEWVTNQAGPVTVRHTVCREPYPPGGAAMQAPPPCACPAPAPLCDPINDLIADNDDVVDWTLSDTCQVTVVVDATKVVTCIFGYDAYLRAGPVTVVYPVCESPCGGMTCPPPYEGQMADPFPTCVRECSPLPSSACQLRDATPATLQHPLWGYDCTLDVHTACLGGASSSTDARVGFVDISIAHCSGPAWS
jgi:hypothetical protein